MLESEITKIMLESEINGETEIPEIMLDIEMSGETEILR